MIRYIAHFRVPSSAILFFFGCTILNSYVKELSVGNAAVAPIAFLNPCFFVSKQSVTLIFNCPNLLRRIFSANLFCFSCYRELIILKRLSVLRYNPFFALGFHPIFLIAVRIPYLGKELD